MRNSLQFQIAEKLLEVNKDFKKYNNIEICYMIFKNLQISDNNISGLRLTKLGFNILKKQYDNYTFSVSEGIHKRLVLVLHKKMKWPYYLDSKQLVLFSEDDAMWLKLVGNDIEKFARNIE